MRNPLSALLNSKPYCFGLKKDIGNCQLVCSVDRALTEDLVTVAKRCILHRCLKEVKTSRHYIVPVVGYVNGLWYLRKNTLELMKVLQPPVALELQPLTYDLYVDAFEKALKMLLTEELIKERRLNRTPSKNSYKRTFAITEQGIKYYNSFSREVIMREQ